MTSPAGSPAGAGRRVIITGASTGIGAATVRRAVGAGWKVLATARRAERLAALAEETGCDWVAADLTTDEGPGQVVAKARELGGFTSLVNVCGVRSAPIRWRRDVRRIGVTCMRRT